MSVSRVSDAAKAERAAERFPVKRHDRDKRDRAASGTRSHRCRRYFTPCIMAVMILTDANATPDAATSAIVINVKYTVG